ncbi:hypothetical protein B0H94_11073 [Salsuginibacillus halophilus]|uniref:Uncharacterized protein n=1 Tax=Salsuginibacillus halophilus TaxID=517424 RepID=A0A2P8HBJ0_9BACI|nr:hypothetical protein [Salsuginibacillus halophilus]PSL43597.1 hypothetical protein B0H94_11073 [Salsuginibacillus halophilus]
MSGLDFFLIMIAPLLTVGICLVLLFMWASRRPTDEQKREQFPVNRNKS